MVPSKRDTHIPTPHICQGAFIHNGVIADEIKLDKVTVD